MVQIFNLASDEKQDEILSNFPIETGTNWFEGEFNTSDVSSPAHHANKIVEVTGKGIITYLKSGGANTNFVVEIDGVRRAVTGGIQISLPGIMPFKSHMKVTATLGNNNGVDVGYSLF